MSISSCGVESCRKRVKAKGLCSTHYARFRSKGTTERPCRSCGQEVVSRSGTVEYCSESCRVCAAPGCEGSSIVRGYCDGHYSRIKRHGVAYLACVTCAGEIYALSGMKKYCSAACFPKCGVSDCERPVEAKGYCKGHYPSFWKYGKPDGAYRCVPQSDKYECLVCKLSFAPNGESRKFCSRKCAALFSRHGDSLPSLDFTCKKCGERVERDRFEGKFHKPNKSICDTCIPHPNNRGWYSMFYRSPEGQSRTCKLCSKAVDMDLKWPHPLSSSIDHIVPVSKGGSDELENLQLAHLVCNQRKQDSVKS